MIDDAVQQSHRPQILVIDDSRINLKLLMSILGPHGYHVRPASSGRLALQSVAAEPPDLILLDVKMPDMDGYEVCRRLKSDEQSRKIPVIFVSALDETTDKIKGFGVGGVDYITKPFQPAEVLARVETHLALRFMQEELEAQNHQLQQEISERIRMEEALRDSEERVRLLIERSPLGIALIREGSYVYSNSALTNLVGFESPDGIVGRPMTYCIGPGDAEAIIRAQEDVMAGKALLNSTEVKGLRQDGTLFDMTLWQSRIDFPEGPATLVFAADMSEEKTLRAQLLHAQKMEAVSTLSGGIAHEFNNLLTIISGYTGLLLADKEEGHSEYADLLKIMASCDRGAELVKRLTTFGRRTETHRSPVDVNREIEQIKDLICRTIPRMIDVEVSLADDLRTVAADAGQLGQVLVNLALNSRDAMPQGGNLTFATRNVCLNREHCERFVGAKPGEYVEVTVSDTGNGMTKETLDHIFEPFYTTRSLAERSGLGLAVAYAIVQAHAGYIACDSKVGKGTACRIYLPSTSAKVIEQEHTKFVEPQDGAGTILVVDDEEMIRHMADRILSRAGYRVLTAADGEHAVDLYGKARETVSLVILDLIMPGMGGKQCLVELFKIDPNVKVLICSGVALDDYSKEFLETCTRGWVTKPYDKERLLEAVQHAVKSECSPTFGECPLNYGMDQRVGYPC